MIARKIWAGLVVLVLGVGIALIPSAQSQPGAQQGVEVLARGPVHEAFASLTAEAVASPAIPKQPPAPLEELAPTEKPEGDSIWISGYWHWDEERKDFLWVSGIWRSVPPGRNWVAGYWRDGGAGNWQWVPGFWAPGAKEENAGHEVTYLPAPPALPNVAPPGEKPKPESFYVPGHWVWYGDRYVWQAGRWVDPAPGYVWVPDHFRWTPGGYVYVPGYWDYAVANRGILYAPVVVRPEVVTVGFVYTPAYAIRETVVVDSLWVRPTTCHYYFGDYYGPAYREYGYESCVVYSRRNYDSIIVYETYERRRDPDWINIQIRLYDDRYNGRAPVPPRTLVQQQQINVTQINQTNITQINQINQTNVYNTTVIAPAAQVAAAKGVKVTQLDVTTRQAAVQQAVAMRQVSAQRVQTEAKVAAAGPVTKPTVQTLAVVKPAPVKPGFTPTVTASTAPPRPTANTPATNTNTNTTAGGKMNPMGGTQSPGTGGTSLQGTQHPQQTGNVTTNPAQGSTTNPLHGTTGSATTTTSPLHGTTGSATTTTTPVGGTGSTGPGGQSGFSRPGTTTTQPPWPKQAPPARDKDSKDKDKDKGQRDR
jgi:hypothetical protein